MGIRIRKCGETSGNADSMAAKVKSVYGDEYGHDESRTAHEQTHTGYKSFLWQSSWYVWLFCVPFAVAVSAGFRLTSQPFLSLWRRIHRSRQPLSKNEAPADSDARRLSSAPSSGPLTHNHKHICLPHMHYSNLRVNIQSSLFEKSCFSYHLLAPFSLSFSFPLSFVLSIICFSRNQNMI